MGWGPISSNGRLTLDWADLLSKGVDPYLVWADTTGFKGLVGAEASAGHVGRVRVAFMWQGKAQSPPTRPLRHIVSMPGDVHFATADVNDVQLRALIVAPNVKCLELGAQLERDERPAAASRTRPTQIGGKVMAVIDFGCAFAHQRFRTRQAQPAKWKSRIAYFWDQHRADGAAASKPWRQPWRQGYGRELTRSAIERLFNANLQGDAVDEDRCYEDARYRDVQLELMHGTHVLDLAAGESPTAESDTSIIFVQLPRPAVADTSGSSMAVFVADALRYILDRVTNDASVVVNLSYGSMAGPHDGSTLVEMLMDATVMVEKSRRRKRFDIVLPAGNSFALDAHAVLSLPAAGRSDTLYWEVLADDPTDTFLELWYDRTRCTELRVKVTPPGGRAAFEVAVNECAAFTEAGAADPMCAVVHSSEASSGATDAMALIALAPTVSAPGRAVAPFGVWKVQVILNHRTTEPVEVRAWIERDDPWLGSGLSPRQSRFLSAETPDAIVRPPIKTAMTCNSIANGHSTVVAGGCLAKADGVIAAPYSSRGPTRSRGAMPWPDYSAPSDEDFVTAGVLAAGTRSGIVVRMNGTSVAAPQVARWLLKGYEADRFEKRQGPVEPPLGRESEDDKRRNGPDRVGPALPLRPDA